MGTPALGYMQIQVICKCYTVLYKGLEYLWALVSMGSPGINPQRPRDNCTVFLWLLGVRGAGARPGCPKERSMHFHAGAWCCEGLGTSKGATGWRGRLQDPPVVVLYPQPHSLLLSLLPCLLPLWCLLTLLDLFSSLGLFTTFPSPCSIS